MGGLEGGIWGAWDGAVFMAPQELRYAWGRTGKGAQLRRDPPRLFCAVGGT